MGSWEEWRPNIIGGVTGDEVLKKQCKNIEASFFYYNSYSSLKFVFSSFPGDTNAHKVQAEEVSNHHLDGKICQNIEYNSVKYMLVKNVTDGGIDMAGYQGLASNKEKSFVVAIKSTDMYGFYVMCVALETSASGLPLAFTVVGRVLSALNF